MLRRLSGRTDSAVVVERLLSISGEDALTINRKNLSHWTGTLPTRLMLLSNELPRLGDSSGALASRMLLLVMRNSWFGREDHGLTDRLMGELPQILLWAVEGWAKLQRDGRFTQPDSAREMLSDLEDLTSPVGEFIRERCHILAAGNIARRELYAAYCDWCKANGRQHVEDQTGFGRNLTAAVPEIKSSNRRTDFGRERYYEGIVLA